MEFPIFVDDAEQLGFLSAKQIDLVEQKKYRRGRFLSQVEHGLIFLTESPRDIYDQQEQIASFQGLTNFGHHFARQGSVCPVYARSVDEHDLSPGAVLLLGDLHDSENAVASGLRFRADNCELLAYECIEQRRLASVSSPEDTNESGVKGHRNSGQEN